ncbi:MAG: signal peptidase II [Candidatus Saganbacteria bacterium]|nr:signal peptidase II [Candidatus Saganbacteria bacterium]
MFFYPLALAIILIDQALKYFVEKSMYLGQSIPLIHGLLKLTYVRNTGAAFSLFSGFSPLLVVIGVVVVAVVIYFHYRVPKDNYMLQVGLAFILGGSLGNIIDRIFRSYVIDYIDFGFWPVFNFADMMINLGVLLVVICVLKGERDKRP